jgi:4-oxalomesaconate tautomerase
MWMRGGTSKGGYFLAEDLPADIGERDAFLLRVMGSPDPRQIDGMGGADPLTRPCSMANGPTPARMLPQFWAVETSGLSTNTWANR